MHHSEAADAGRTYLAWVESAEDFEDADSEAGFVLLDLLHPDEIALIRSGEFTFESLVERPIKEGLKTLPLVLSRRQIEAGWMQALTAAVSDPGQRLSVRLRADNQHAEEQGGRAVLALTGWDQDEGAQQEVFIESIELAPEELAREVDAALSSTQFSAAFERLPQGAPNRASFLRDVLEHSVWDLEKAFVGVYDVGQGSASALVDHYEHPLVFFDIGKPISVYDHTKPSLYPRFFNCDRANENHTPVVLSHWDFDHWAGVLQSAYVRNDRAGVKHAVLTLIPDALERYWIAPNQEHLNLGPTHRELIRLLKKSTNGSTSLRALQYWPDSLGQLPFTHGVIVRSVPDARASESVSSQRNNSGLAMLITFRRDISFSPSHWLLLPGDARWESIPIDFGDLELVGMVIAHHGGKLGAVPQASGWACLDRKNPNVVCSVGRVNWNGNRPYGHPHDHMQLEHAEGGWDANTFTYDAAPSRACPKALGNYCLSLDGTQPQCGCDCACDGNLSLNPVSGWARGMLYAGFARA